MNFIDVSIFVFYSASIAALLIMLLLLIFGSRKRPHGFILFLSILILWLGLQYVAQYLFFDNEDIANLLVRVAILAASFMVLALYIFVASLSVKKYRNKYLDIFSGLIPIVGLIAISSLGNLNIVVSKQGIAVTSDSPYYAILLASIFIAFIFAIRAISRFAKNKQSKYNERAMTLLARAFLIATIIILIAAVFFGDSQFAQVLTPISMSALSFVAYLAIFRHGLFDVRLIIARSFAYTLSLTVVISIFTLGAFSLSNIIFDSTVTLAQELFFGVFSAIIALVFQPIKKFFDRITNTIFYRDAYDVQDFLNNINARIVKSNDLYTLLTETAEDIRSTVKVNNVGFYIDSSAAIDFHTAGTNTALFAKTEWSELLIDVNKLDKKAITSESLEVPEDTIKLMRKLNIELILKMTSKDENVGYLLLSERKSGTNFGLQDIQVLEIIADELAITVQNTVQLEQIAQFNVTLQKKINNATNELQQSNEKLVKLDEAKDEFISMASHQLRTPLTSVKGYISMILEGDAGEINETQKKFLDQAYISSQRMVYLIADLLNVSRLKTGKFVIEKAPTYLPDVIESEVSQLYGTAEARDLKMIFHKPKEFPTIDLDETKIRQVIMNFADNAIYYTPHGGKITIELKKLKNSIEYTVTDTGIGVPKAEQHHLFNKFYRAGNAKKARPDGTGLGLYMAKKVVVAQGGAIIFKTTEGKGSTFGFTFPLPKEESEKE